MKKLLIVVAAAIALVLPNVSAISKPEVTDHEKVTIYLFRGHGCSHCYEALEYFNENIDEYSDYIEFVSFEIWNDSNNHSLASKVGNKMGDEVNGVPYFVVGSSYSTAGFASSTGEEIIKTALKEYKNKNYKDIVKPLLNDSYTPETLEEACVAEGIKASNNSRAKKNNTSETLIVIGIIVVLVGGVAALIISNRRD